MDDPPAARHAEGHAPEADGRRNLDHGSGPASREAEGPRRHRTEAAHALVKMYSMALAQGIARTQWFEAATRSVKTRGLAC